MNYAVWESSEAFRSAFTNPKFVEKIGSYPKSVVATPHLFEKVAIPGICVA